MPTAVIGIVAILIGLFIGYLSWGASAGKLSTELTAAKAKVAEAQQAAVREGALATKVQDLESQLKQASESLGKEKETREKLEKLAAKLKK